MSSIDHGPEQETADTPAEQIALVDGSVGSDTDSGGPLKQDEAVKDGSDIPHHARSNSVKKPTTFKAVSVTKNFLAKAGTPTAPAAKTNGDNGSTHANRRLEYKRLTTCSAKYSHRWNHHTASTSTSAGRQDRQRKQGCNSKVLTFQQ